MREMHSTTPSRVEYVCPNPASPEQRRAILRRIADIVGYHPFSEPDPDIVAPTTMEAPKVD